MQSLNASLTRIAEAEQRAERDYRQSVSTQIERDKVEVPRLSGAAAAVLEAVHAATGREQPGNYWQQVQPRNRSPSRGS